MNPQNVIDRAAHQIVRNLLPDRCTITTVGDELTMSERGILTATTRQREYNGSTSIPCRLDSSRSFRPERLPNQEINANEYVLHLPTTVYIKPNDKVSVTVDGLTHVFEVRKLTSLSSWRVTNSALIVELEGQHD